MNKKNIIITLTAVTVLLGFFSIYIGMRLGESNSPNTVPTNNTTAENPNTIVPTNVSASSGSKVCGESCNTDSDCSNPFLPYNKDAIQCIAGKCQNVNCPADTEFGVTCNCVNNTKSCGEKCGGLLLPLCGDGKSKCGFIKTVNQCNTIADDYELNSDEWQTYCIPLEPAEGYTRSVCSDGAPNESLRKENGNTAVTVAELQEACKDEPVVVAGSVCGNNIVEEGESCDKGSANGTVGAQCNSSCNIPACDNNLDDDSDGLIDKLDPGCHTDNDATNDASYDINRTEIDALPATAISQISLENIGSILLGIIFIGICTALAFSKPTDKKIKFVTE